VKKASARRHIFTVLRIAVVCAGLLWGIWWLSQHGRWEKILNIFARMNLFIFAIALAIFLLAQAAISFRWWLLVRCQHIELRLLPAVRLYFLGWFYNNFMPGSVGGDFIRAWYVTKHTHKRFQAVLTVFVDRLVGMASTLSIAAFFYLLFLRREAGIALQGPKLNTFEKALEQGPVAIWFVGVIALCLAILCLFQKGRLVVKKSCQWLLQSTARMWEKFKDAVRLYYRSPLTIVAAYIITVSLQAFTIVGFWLLGTNIGLEVSIKYYFVFFTLTWVLGAVPVSIAGAVVVEGALAYLFVQYAGAGSEASVALALCQRIIWMLASLPGAAIHIMGAHLPKQISIDYDSRLN